MSMQTKRSITTCVILSFVTCGIYLIYWEIKLAKEVIAVKDEKDDGVLEIVLLLLLPFLGLYMVEKKFYDGCVLKGYVKEDKSIVYLVLGLVGLGLVALALIQSELNKYIDAFASGKISSQNNNLYTYAQNNNYGQSEIYQHAYNATQNQPPQFYQTAINNEFVYCVKCGKQNSGDAMFCCGCGQSIERN